MRNRFLIDPAEVAIEAARSLPEAMGAGERAVHVEIGFGKDVRILRMAQTNPEARFLGVEISRKKARKFCEKAARLGLSNVRGYWGDAREVLKEMLPAGSIASFTVLFPDPWPKRKHWKHRWIQADTARLMHAALASGGELVVATDHDGYMAHIRDVLSAAGFVLEYSSAEIPEDDVTLFAQRFARLGESVAYTRWSRP